MTASVKDSNGEPIRKHDVLTMTRAPEDLTRGLPPEDQSAIRDQVGSTVVVVGFDDHGNVEVEFSDRGGTLHTIWIEPACLQR